MDSQFTEEHNQIDNVDSFICAILPETARFCLTDKCAIDRLRAKMRTDDNKNDRMRYGSRI